MISDWLLRIQHSALLLSDRQAGHLNATFSRILLRRVSSWWYAVAQLVQALRYKTEDRGLDSR